MVSISPVSQDSGLISQTPVKKRADSIKSVKLIAVGTAMALTVSFESKAPVPPAMENTIADSNREISICAGNGDTAAGHAASSSPVNKSTPDAWERAAAKIVDNNLLIIYAVRPLRNTAILAAPDDSS